MTNTAVSYHPTPRRAGRDTPRPQNPPTQTLFARGPVWGGGHWRVLVTGICCPRYGRWITDHPGPNTHENCIFAGPGIVPPLHRGEPRPYRRGKKFPSAEGCRRSRRGGLSRVTSNESRVTKTPRWGVFFIHLYLVLARVLVLGPEHTCYPAIHIRFCMPLVCNHPKTIHSKSVRPRMHL